MWFLEFLPYWIFYAILILGVLGLILNKFVPIQYKTLTFPISLFLFVLGLFMLGAIQENKSWVQKVKEMELKVAEAEVKSQKENVVIVEKVLYKDKVIREKSADIIKYVDREIVKYNDRCVLPKEVVNVLNEAAENVK
jgi:hypothetical protein